MEQAKRVLEQYNIIPDQVEPLRQNENKTYRVQVEGKQFVLRIHQSVETMNLSLIRGEKSSEALIEGEMELLTLLAMEPELGTQVPVKNKYGVYVTEVDGAFATLLTWAEGAPLEKEKIGLEEAYHIGEMLGKVHRKLKGYVPEHRYRYDATLIERMREVLDREKENAVFSPEQIAVLREMLNKLGAFLAAEQDRVILVHNDLGESNLLYRSGTFVPIDFSMSGVCVPEMDLASLYCHFEARELREAILAGYESVGKEKVEKTRIHMCIGLQLLVFLLSQYQHIYQAPWFCDMVNYWCYEIFQKILDGQKPEEQIGLFS